MSRFVSAGVFLRLGSSLSLLAIVSSERPLPPTSPTKQNFVIKFLPLLEVRIIKSIRISLLHIYISMTLGVTIKVSFKIDDLK